MHRAVILLSSATRRRRGSVGRYKWRVGLNPIERGSGFSRFGRATRSSLSLPKKFIELLLKPFTGPSWMPIHRRHRNVRRHQRRLNPIRGGRIGRAARSSFSLPYKPPWMPMRRRDFAGFAIFLNPGARLRRPASELTGPCLILKKDGVAVFGCRFYSAAHR